MKLHFKKVILFTISILLHTICNGQTELIFWNDSVLSQPITIDNEDVGLYPLYSNVTVLKPFRIKNSRLYGDKNFTRFTFLDTFEITHTTFLNKESTKYILTKYPEIPFKKKSRHYITKYTLTKHPRIKSQFYPSPDDAINFSTGNYPKYVNLSSNTFNYRTFLAYSKFNERVNLRLTKFNATIHILSNIFVDTVSFDSCINNNTNKGLPIARCSFRSHLSFRHAKLNSSLSFTEDTIYTADFDGLTLEKELSFNHVIFKSRLSLNAIKYSQSAKLVFNSVTLPDTIYFAFNKDITNEIDFTTAQFNDNKIHYINLYKSDISKIKLDYTHFKLFLTGPTHTETLYMVKHQYNKQKFISKKEISIDEASSIYEALLKNFKDRGQILSYRLCDIDYQDYLRYKSIGLGYMFYSFKKHINNYGYEKERILKWTFALLFMFTILTFFIIERLMFRVYDIENISKQPFWRNNTPYSILKLLGLRLWYSLVYTSVIFFLLSFKVEKLKYQSILLVLYIITVYTTGIICLAYIANYIITR